MPRRPNAYSNSGVRNAFSGLANALIGNASDDRVATQMQADLAKAREYESMVRMNDEKTRALAEQYRINQDIANNPVLRDNLKRYFPDGSAPARTEYDLDGSQNVIPATRARYSDQDYSALARMLSDASADPNKNAQALAFFEGMVNDKTANQAAYSGDPRLMRGSAIMTNQASAVDDDFVPNQEISDSRFKSELANTLERQAIIEETNRLELEDKFKLGSELNDIKRQLGEDEIDSEFLAKLDKNEIYRQIEEGRIKLEEKDITLKNERSKERNQNERDIGFDKNRRWSDDQNRDRAVDRTIRNREIDEKVKNNNANRTLEEKARRYETDKKFESDMDSNEKRYKSDMDRNDKNYRAALNRAEKAIKKEIDKAQNKRRTQKVPIEYGDKQWVALDNDFAAFVQEQSDSFDGLIPDMYRDYIFNTGMKAYLQDWASNEDVTKRRFASPNEAIQAAWKDNFGGKGYLHAPWTERNWYYPEPLWRDMTNALRNGASVEQLADRLNSERGYPTDTTIDALKEWADDNNVVIKNGKK